ncbi:cyclin-D-binding Myb-like transcription factor 1 [Nannospalax galili]|uniref:cyclin-D-binding Myb-like transcription factor 1 n=1 Tax=Nannospalax galili TaxID=1026970 RepID=UPI00111C8E67|nr:cyclin-D-binding Myb-like transcription factor 1 [Nannospalax galili]
MNILEDSSEAPTPEIVNSLVTHDTDKEAILCLQNEVAEKDHSSERAMMVTSDVAKELTERRMMQVSTLQNYKPDEASPLDDEDDSVVNQGWSRGKKYKTTATIQEHKWKLGMWSKEETEILTSNIECYMMANGINDVSEIIFKMSKCERRNFYRSIARGLNRPLFSVYRRVIRMYDDGNHKGKYTTEETEKFKELCHQHGNDWASIGAALGRSVSSVKRRYQLMNDTHKTGKWAEEEERTLAEVVHELTKTNPGEQVTKGVPWTAVAQRVCTRSAKQCRSKWLTYLNWKQSGGIEWTRKDGVTLILRLAELDVADESDIHWDLLAKGWSSVRSPQWLRDKWWAIKKQVSNYKDIAFPVYSMLPSESLALKAIQSSLQFPSKSFILQTRSTLSQQTPLLLPSALKQ